WFSQRCAAKKDPHSAARTRRVLPADFNRIARGRSRWIAYKGRSLLGAPRTELSGPHSGTRLPPRVFDGEALLGPGMKDAGPGEKVIRQLRESRTRWENLGILGATMMGTSQLYPGAGGGAGRDAG